MANDSTRATSRRRVLPRDLQQLYELVKGARYASQVMDAKLHLEQDEPAEARRMLESVAARHQANHDKTAQRIMDLEATGNRGDLDRARRLKDKKFEQGTQAHEMLQWLIPCLQRAEERSRQRDTQPSGAASPESATGAVGHPALTQALLDEFHATRTLEPKDRIQAQLDVIDHHFRREAFDEGGLESHDSLLMFLASDQVHLVAIAQPMDAADPSESAVSLVQVVTGQKFKPTSWRTLRNLGSNGRLARLRPVTEGPEPDSRSTLEEAPNSGESQATSSVSPSLDSAETPAMADSTSTAPLAKDGYSDDQRDRILDMGAFSQLAEAAQRCGIVADADLIAHVRDREFRFRDYAKAFQTMESVYGKFIASASQREQRLRQEEMMIKSGRVKMSPKELQAKRQRDTYETQLIERARSRFMRVMEGLRILMRT